MVPTLIYRIRDFQRYVARQARLNRDHWTHAKALLLEVADILAEMHGHPPPVELTNVCRRLGISLVDSHYENRSFEAILLPEKGGLTVSLKRKCAAGKTYNLRERFTIAHEIGHSMFYDNNRRPPVRLVPGSMSPQSKSFVREEQLCNSFAAALLVPIHSRSQVCTMAPCFASLTELSSHFLVSREVLIRRIKYDFCAWRGVAFYKLALNSEGTIRVQKFAEKVSERPPQHHLTAKQLECRLTPPWKEGITGAISRAFGVGHIELQQTSSHIWWVAEYAESTLASHNVAQMDLFSKSVRHHILR